MIGQEGEDILWGGEGADVFVLTNNEDNLTFDYIKDYVDGEDKLGLINLNFDSLVISQNGIDTEIKDSEGNILVLIEGIDSTLISEDDFMLLDYDLTAINGSVDQKLSSALVSNDIDLNAFEDSEDSDSDEDDDDYDV